MSGFRLFHWVLPWTLNYEDDGSKIEGNRLRIAKRYVHIMENEDEAVRYVERIRRLKQLLK